MSRLTASIAWVRQTVGSATNTWSWTDRVVLAAFLGAFATGLLFTGILGIWSLQAASLVYWACFAVFWVVLEHLGLLRWSGPALAWFIVSVAFGAILTAWFDSWWCLVYWIPFALLWIVLEKLGFLKLLGPVLFYDMLTTARRGRYSLIRVAYSLLLLMVLFWVWMTVWAGGFQRLTDREAAGRIAMGFFSAYTVVQLIAVFLLTPAYVAGSIAEEKERKTLEFMLATDLRNREIVLSKFGSRVLNMLLFILTGLPILSGLQFMGGVDPDMVIASFIVTGLTVIGLASVSIFSSVVHKRPRDAIAMVYFIAIGYIAIATVAFPFARYSGWWVFGEPVIWFLEAEWYNPTWGQIVSGFNAGNVIAVIWQVEESTMGFRRGGGGSLATVLPQVVWEYFVFYAIVGGLCLTYAVLRLRGVALKQSYGKTAKARWWQRFRDPVGELPILWKEMNVEGALRFNWLGWLFVILLVCFTLGIGLTIVGWHFWEVFFEPNRWHGGFYESMSWWARITGAGVGYIILLGVAVRASTTIRSEMDKDTFDALVTTPVSANQILLAKFIGAVFSVRLGWLWMGSIFGLALVTSSMHILALPLVLGAWVVYACFFSMIGLWFSMVSKTTMRATVYTMFTTIGVSFGHWLVFMLCCMPVIIFLQFRRAGMGGGGDELAKHLFSFMTGITPPIALGVFAYPQEDLADGRGRDNVFLYLLGYSLLGIFLYTMASLMLWFVLIQPRFRYLTRRDQSSSEAE